MYMYAQEHCSAFNIAYKPKVTRCSVESPCPSVHASMIDLARGLAWLLTLSLCVLAPSAYEDHVEGVICTSVRNEAPYIQEWLEFHLLVGATKFVIYDDKSTDGLKVC